MTPQFKEQFTTRGGSSVAVQVHYTQGLNGKMTEKKALERAAQMIGRKLDELGAGEQPS